jgi:hypothetical protein
MEEVLTKMSKGLILSTSFVFFVYGLLCLFFPVEVLRDVVEGSVSSASGIIELRSNFGGLYISIAVILYMLASNETTIRVGLISVLIIMLGMAAGRSLGFFIDGSPTWAMYLYLSLEIIIASLSIMLLTKNQG